MSIKAILFDLDGTLLPMDQETFARAYMGGLVKVAAGNGYDPNKAKDAILAGTYAMVKNQGDMTNEEAFWQVFVGVFGDKVLKDSAMFDNFYRTDFQNIKQVCGFLPEARKIIDHVKSKGFRVALATNPLFPRVATESRIRWAGLEPSDFELFTSYETSRHCKPDLGYYKDVLSELGLSAEECVMVGNDVGEDMIALKLGMKVFLLTGCIINRKGEDISVYPHGGAEDLISFIDSLR